MAPDRSVSNMFPLQEGLGVALGGGGMKGWAHVGVISVLHRHSLQPDVISGCSIGAIMGAYYASGHGPDEMVALMRSQPTASLFPLRFDGQGLLSADNLRAYLNETLDAERIEDLPIPFYVVCTDLESGQEVILREGPLVDAILASSAMPGIFAPVELGGRLLVDGGLRNNVPVSALVHHGVRYTIAVRLRQEQRPLETRSLRRKPMPDAAETWSISISNWAERLARSIRKDDGLPNGLEVAARALDLVVAQIEQYRLQAYPPNILISPRVAHISPLSFSEEKDTIYRYGVEAAEQHSDALAEMARRLGATPHLKP